MSEFDKILDFLSFAKERALDSSSEDSGRRLFERWELRKRPQPFPVEGGKLDFAGRVIEVPFKGPCFARCLWDSAGSRLCLQVESETCRWRLPFRFAKGELSFLEPEISPLKAPASKRGALLELAYDVIDHFRTAGLGLEFSKISKKSFVERVDAVAACHDPEIIKELKALPVGEIRKLLKDASADMAEDEFGGQLSLGLDGSYANARLDDPSESDFRDAHIPARTPWEVLSELEYISASCRFKLESERAFVLPFKDAQVVGEPEEGDLPIKVPVELDAPLSQGDIVYIRRKGEPGTCGTFKIDVLDGDFALGRLRCDFAKDAGRGFPEMAGTLPRSPSEFIASGLCRLAISLEKDEKLSPAQDFALGLRPFSLKGSEASLADASSLDASQRRAVELAANPENPVVLVQGPPGTGKSFVLERVLRELCAKGARILVAAPSNTAVDNICRRASGLPVARFGNNPESLAPDVRAANWIGEPAAIERFLLGRRRFNGGAVFAGTCVGLLRDRGIQDEIDRNGLFDAILVDEAGMCSVSEFLLCAGLAKRVLLFGDHQQLPPFPLPRCVEARLLAEFPFVAKEVRASSSVSALEYLTEGRGLPVALLRRSYRCQNPKLLRFASTLFYEALVKPSVEAEYYRLPYRERELRYPRSTMRIHSTSSLPEELRAEQLCFDGRKPGIANEAEAKICASILYESLRRHPLNEICVIAPYRKQVSLIRETLSLEAASAARGAAIPQAEWDAFLATRVATVDSFQGGESDVVIICYVRGNKDGVVGFIDNPNRINVAHTRCRREMHIVGDMEFLVRHAKSGIFSRIERAFRRDGELVEVSALPVSTLFNGGELQG